MAGVGIFGISNRILWASRENNSALHSESKSKWGNKKEIGSMIFTSEILIFSQSAGEESEIKVDERNKKNTRQ